MADETKDPLREALRQLAEWAQESALAEERRASKHGCGHEEWIAHRERAKAYRDCESMARAALSAVSAPPPEPEDEVPPPENLCACGAVMLLGTTAALYRHTASECGSVPAAPPPDPQGREEILDRCRKAVVVLRDILRNAGLAGVDVADQLLADISAMTPETAGQALRALRASVSGAPGVACPSCGKRGEIGVGMGQYFCRACGAYGPEAKLTGAPRSEKGKEERTR